MSAKSDPRAVPAVRTYHYRRDLRLREMLPAVGVGIAVGAAAFYVALIAKQRTALVPGDTSSVSRDVSRRRSHRARGG